MSQTPENAVSSGQMLRSSAEIGRVLKALAARREAVTAQLAGEGETFSSQIIHADLAGQFIYVKTATSEPANAALLAARRVTMVCAPGDWRIEFVATEPLESTHDGAPAIRLRIPEVVSAQQRRRHPRTDAPPRIELHCVADAGGVTPFHAQIVDVSPGGIGSLDYPPDITLEPGTVLVECRIEVPGKKPLSVDLEVQYSEVFALPDGSRARRSGFRFLKASDDVKMLVDALGKR